MRIEGRLSCLNATAFFTGMTPARKLGMETMLECGVRTVALPTASIIMVGGMGPRWSLLERVEPLGLASRLIG